MKAIFKKHGNQYTYTEGFDINKQYQNKVIWYNENNLEEKNKEVNKIIAYLKNKLIKHEITIDTHEKFCLIKWNI